MNETDIRIPLRWLIFIVLTCLFKKYWKFKTKGGNILVAKRAKSLPDRATSASFVIDFWYNPGD